MLCEYFNRMLTCSFTEIEGRRVFDEIEKSRLRARKELLSADKPHVLYAIKFYAATGELISVQIHRNAFLSDDELDAVIKAHSNAYFGVLHKDTCKKACAELLKREKRREIRSIPLKMANAFVNKNHRHHQGTVGCKFAIGLYECDKLIGVAICGRPVSRYLDNGYICEINRLCTIGDKNACSQLYGACSQIAKAMGYQKIITYILQSESGISLRASNFVCEGVAGGTHWTGKRDKGQAIPHEMKTRWVRQLV